MHGQSVSPLAVVLQGEIGILVIVLFSVLSQWYIFVYVWKRHGRASCFLSLRLLYLFFTKNNGKTKLGEDGGLGLTVHGFS